MMRRDCVGLGEAVWEERGEFLDVLGGEVLGVEFEFFHGRMRSGLGGEGLEGAEEDLETVRAIDLGLEVFGDGVGS